MSDDSSDPQSSLVVLVADDDEDILALITIGLKKAGYRVLTATDGEQALQLALDGKPDLAVLDIKMPGLTGLEVTERVRAAQGAANAVPIMLLTASVNEGDIASGFEAGANDFMKKPFSPEELRTRVRGLLRRESQKRVR